MNVITGFRTLFFGILAVCVLFVVSENVSAEYYKSPIWSRDTCTLNVYDESVIYPSSVHIRLNL